MKNTNKSDWKFWYGCIACISAVFMLVCAVCLFALATPAEAAQADQTDIMESADDSAVTPRLCTYLTLSLSGGDGKVRATVKNSFTLFPSTVYVIVELYSSDTYYESYSDMTLVSKNTIADLDIGKSISTESGTGGVQKYWHGRMRYKIDSGSWKSETTGTILFSADGSSWELA